MSSRLALALCIALGTGMVAHAATPAPLSTVAERSGFTNTGRYDEVIALCDGFAQRYPDAVTCFDFGTTPEGRPMKALAVTRSGARTPDAARAKGLPVLLVQGGIHAGEIDGKDAGFWLLRDLLDGKVGKGLLEKQVVLFVPVFNVDGHENFRAWNRPNQRGPEEMGFRVTAQRYNLNRDYVKADSPEMQALLRLFNAWDPALQIDLHVTDGAKFQHDISITGGATASQFPALVKAGDAVRDGIIAGLRKQGSTPVGFYPSFVDGDDPASGFVDGVATPRFSHGYYPLRNRIAILVETHSWRTYPERVRSTRNSVLNLMTLAARDGQQWLQAERDADAQSAAIGGQPVAMDFRATDKVRTIDFLGYAYTRTPSEISGDLMTRYDESKPQIWKVPLRDELVPGTQIAAPRAGYLVPAAWSAMVARQLDIHGIDYKRIEQPLRDVAVEEFRADKAQFSPGTVEGHQRVSLQGKWNTANASLPAGSLFVPIAQAKSKLLMHILEPQGTDSIAAWGGFNNAFDQKEYMEPYVAEEQARLMLANDPQLKAEFERKLKEDAEFAKSPYARLAFFARRHAAWDRGVNLYPVRRVDRMP